MSHYVFGKLVSLPFDAAVQRITEELVDDQDVALIAAEVRQVAGAHDGVFSRAPNRE